MATFSIALAIVIIGWQSLEVSTSFARAWNSPLWITPYIAWPSIFILLGYGLAGRSNELETAKFLKFLIIVGLLPTTLVIVGTALLLGPTVTTNSVSSYFADPDVWFYLLNLVGWPKFNLPGVFEFNNLNAVVNEPVWTIPCAALTTAIALTSFRQRRMQVAAVVAGLLVIAAIVTAFNARGGDNAVLALALCSAFGGQLGILAYELRDRLRVGPIWAFASFCALGAFAFMGSGGSLIRPDVLLMASVLATGPVLFCAARRWPLAKLSEALAPYVGAALIIAFPIQQLTASRPSVPQDAIDNLVESLPAIMLGVVLVVHLSRGIVGIIAPPVTDMLSLPTISGWRLQRLRRYLTNKRRSMPPLLMAYAGLVVATLVILAMTLFALQREP